MRDQIPSLRSKPGHGPEIYRSCRTLNVVELSMDSAAACVAGHVDSMGMWSTCCFSICGGVATIEP